MNLVDIFQQLAYPVAVSVFLFAILAYFTKRALAMLNNILKESETKQREYVEYLKESNARLVSVVEDNTAIIKKFSFLMEKYMKEK